MAFEGILQVIPGLVAGADLSAKQFYAMKIGAADFQVVICAAATDVPVGILQDAPVSGVRANVACFGVSKAIAGGTIARGDLVGTDSSGKLVTYVPGTDTTKYILGKALQSAVSGDLFSVLLMPISRAA